jgi:DNA-binding transcriptional MerR regulator
MFTIGDFAKLGRVSVRMLRHYDSLGLLIPAEVDRYTGYRTYRADQMSRLNRVIALNDLGFTLSQVRSILDEQVSADQLRGMLRLRRAQLEAQLSADAARLMSVEARLRMIEEEGHMSTEEVVVKQVAPVRVAELSGVAASYEGADIGPVIGPLYRELMDRLNRAGVPLTGFTVAYYEAASDVSGDAVTVHAGATVSAPAKPDYDFAIVELPALPAAATIVHRGSMDEADRSMQILARWIEDNGYHMEGYAREVCLEFDLANPSKWVHEFQISITPARMA